MVIEHDRLYCIYKLYIINIHAPKIKRYAVLTKSFTFPFSVILNVRLFFGGELGPSAAPESLVSVNDRFLFVFTEMKREKKLLS